MGKIISFLFIILLSFNNVGCSQTSMTGENSGGTNTKQSSVTSKPTQEKNQNLNQASATLVEVVDGDTIKINFNGKEQTVRYLLIDTPEEKKPGVCVQPVAMDAYNRNKQLLESGRITLEFDHGNKTDKYGRLLAYVFVNGKSVQEELLKDGYARVAYIYEPPYKYLNQYRDDETVAKNKHLRIWAKAGYVTDRGFNGCVNKSIVNQTRQSTSTQSTKSTNDTKSGTEYFANCTDLRKKYPNGVPKGSPAYRDSLDRDKDGYACERN